MRHFPRQFHVSTLSVGERDCDNFKLPVYADDPDQARRCLRSATAMPGQQGMPRPGPRAMQIGLAADLGRRGMPRPGPWATLIAIPRNSDDGECLESLPILACLILPKKVNKPSFCGRTAVKPSLFIFCLRKKNTNLHSIKICNIFRKERNYISSPPSGCAKVRFFLCLCLI